MHKIVIGLLLLLTLSACSHNTNNASPTLTVSPSQNISILYFDGSIAPLNTFNIISPTDGIVTDKTFSYGMYVTKNQKLLVINSSSLNDQYQEALTNYLKTQRDYQDDQIKLQSSENLKKLGIISRDEYMSDKSQFYDMSLSLQQAKFKLQDILTKAGYSQDFISQAFKQTSQNGSTLPNAIDHITITAPTNGVVLLPDANANKNDDSNKPLSKGDEVKQEQTLLAIGDVSGLKLIVKVNQVNINSIAKGQTATVTSDAFDDTLQGVVTDVGQQATIDVGSTIPTFIVTITVPHITPNQLNEIHIGMSAKVALQINSPAEIMIPINAVLIKNGSSYVKLIDKKTHKINEVPVQTGSTSLNSVIIQKGLQAGDEIIVNANAN